MDERPVGPGLGFLADAISNIPERKKKENRIANNEYFMFLILMQR
jgi:hypothetical protein